MKTIFAMIPAYRDPVLLDTLETMYSNADNPDRIFSAIGAQYDDHMAMPDISKFNPKNIRKLEIHPDGRPSVYRLRHILNQLWFGEDYYLSIDSHTIFKQGWDSELIDMLESFTDPKTIIAGYEEDPLTEGSKFWLRPQMSLSQEDLDDGPWLRMLGATEEPWNGERFMPGKYLQAGMFFTRGEFSKDIRWGKLWQAEQEEPFLTFESFMKGYNLQIHLHEHPFTHEPKRYYDAVYNSKPNSPKRDFVDSWSFMKDDRRIVRSHIMQAYLYNKGPFKIENAHRTPKDFWKEHGLIDSYLDLVSTHSFDSIS